MPVYPGALPDTISVLVGSVPSVVNFPLRLVHLECRCVLAGTGYRQIP